MKSKSNAYRKNKKSHKHTKRRVYRGGNVLPESKISNYDIPAEQVVQFDNSNAYVKPKNRTLYDNMGTIANIATSALEAVAVTAANKLGLDSTTSAKDKIKNITSTVHNIANDPELKEDAQRLLNDVIEISKPGIYKSVGIANDLVKKEIPIVQDMAEKAILGIPIVGQGLVAASELTDTVRATENAAKSVAELTTVGSETLKNLETKQSDFMNLIGNATESIKGNIDEYISNQESLNQQAKMVGGRIKESKKRFLNIS